MSKIPKPTGPFQVGSTDIVSSYGKERCLFRLFYPTRLAAGSSGSSVWLPDSQYAYGFMDYSGAGWLTCLAKSILRSARIPAALDADLDLPEGLDKLPVIVFSHGLAGYRTCYSTICTELASHGMAVASLEHGDGSAAAACYFKESPSEDGHIMKKYMGFQKVKSDDPEIHEIRNTQLYSRTSDCSAALDLLTKVNNGNFEGIRNQVDILKFKGKLDMNKCAVVGHSFGGATAAASISKDSRFCAAACLDLWAFPLDDDVFANIPPTRPILFINSETFHWPSNMAKIERILNANKEGKSRMLTLLGSVHQSQSDFSLVVDIACLAKAFGLRGPGDPLAVAQVGNKILVAFLGTHFCLSFGKNVDVLVEENTHIVMRGTNIVSNAEVQE